MKWLYLTCYWWRCRMAITSNSVLVCFRFLILWLCKNEIEARHTNLCKKNSTRFQVLNPNPWAPGQFFLLSEVSYVQYLLFTKVWWDQKKSQSNFGFRRDGQIDGIARNVSDPNYFAVYNGSRCGVGKTARCVTRQANILPQYWWGASSSKVISANTIL